MALEEHTRNPTQLGRSPFADTPAFPFFNQRIHTMSLFWCPSGYTSATLFSPPREHRGYLSLFRRHILLTVLFLNEVYDEILSFLQCP